jgi:hypothetical protein
MSCAQAKKGKINGGGQMFLKRPAVRAMKLGALYQGWQRRIKRLNMLRLGFELAGFNPSTLTAPKNWDWMTLVKSRSDSRHVSHVAR